MRTSRTSSSGPRGHRPLVGQSALLVSTALRLRHEHDSGERGTRARAVVKAGTLTVCTSLPYEPFEFEKDGEPVGFDIDLATRSPKQLDARRRSIVNADFDAIQSG